MASGSLYPFQLLTDNKIMFMTKKSLMSPVPKVLGQSGKPHEPAALWSLRSN